MRTLVIAPEAPGLPPLAMWQEISQIGDIEGVELTVCGGRAATRSRVAAQLRNPWELAIWSGHGQPGSLMAADGLISAEWLACQLRQAPPALAVVSACFSVARDAALGAITTAISQAGINVVGMWLAVEDRAAIVYDVELARAMASGSGVAVAHRVAVDQVALEYPKMAGCMYLTPGLVNGYRQIAQRMDGIEDRLGQVETVIATRMAGVEQKLDLLTSLFRRDGGWET